MAKKIVTAQATARAILKLYRGDASRWTRRYLAQTKTGMECDPASRSATCWCLVGAAYKVKGEISDFHEEIERCSGLRAAQFNDSKTTRFPQIVKLLERIAKG